MNIAVITSGGDSPGMNPCIAKLVLEGERRGHRVFGYIGGYRGIQADKPVALRSRDVYGLFKLGGTVLKSGRLPELVEPEVRRSILEKLRRDEINTLVVMGGDGSFRGAMALGEMSPDATGVNFVGIPCTIDNNIFGSDYTLGHDTAFNKLTQYIDDITDTALSMFSRVFLVETLGGHDGYFARSMEDIGLCDFSVTEEHPLSCGEVVERIADTLSSGNKSFVIISVAEHCETALIAKAVRSKLGIDPKINIIGYQQRGGVPTALERLHAASFALYALRAVESGIRNKYIIFSDGKYGYMDFSSVENVKPFRPWVR
ncbi:MAG: 6-phosphofructokinase [Oscillospiraceae bacterium]|nr:6-phosphofructokinase [Oscillospiraceae bacterium]